MYDISIRLTSFYAQMRDLHGAIENPCYLESRNLSTREKKLLRIAE